MLLLCVCVCVCHRFLSTWERPDAAVLGVVGDFTPSQMLSQLEELIGSWKPAQGQPAEPPQVCVCRGVCVCVSVCV